MAMSALRRISSAVAFVVQRRRLPGRVARIAYTYLHIRLVGGIILAAVGDKLVLAHPEGHADEETAIAVIGGAALYVLGSFLVKRVALGYWPLSHLNGLGPFAVSALLILLATPPYVEQALALVLVAIAVWETRFAAKDLSQP
jgi:low temperature requirement protein LtrA